MVSAILTKKNVHMDMNLILNGHQDTAVWIYKYKSIVNDSKDREITYC